MTDKRLKRTSKGQIWSTDFILSVVILTIVIIPSLLFWNTFSKDETLRNEGLDARKRAFEVTDALMNSKGMPEDWNSSNVITIGLAAEKNILSREKADEMNGSSYQRLKNIVGYDFHMILKDINGSVYYDIGIAPYDNATNIVPVRRSVLMDDRIVILDFVLWR